MVYRSDDDSFSITNRLNRDFYPENPTDVNNRYSDYADTSENNYSNVNYNDYSNNDFADNGYLDNNYSSNGYTNNNYSNSDYSSNEYNGGYSEDNYSDNNYQDNHYSVDNGYQNNATNQNFVLNNSYQASNFNTFDNNYVPDKTMPVNNQSNNVNSNNSVQSAVFSADKIDFSNYEQSIGSSNNLPAPVANKKTTVLNEITAASAALINENNVETRIKRFREENARQNIERNNIINKDESNINNSPKDSEIDNTDNIIDAALVDSDNLSQATAPVKKTVIERYHNIDDVNDNTSKIDSIQTGVKEYFSVFANFKAKLKSLKNTPDAKDSDDNYEDDSDGDSRRIDNKTKLTLAVSLAVLIILICLLISGIIKNPNDKDNSAKVAANDIETKDIDDSDNSVPLDSGDDDSSDDSLIDSSTTPEPSSTPTDVASSENPDSSKSALPSASAKSTAASKSTTDPKATANNANKPTTKPTSKPTVAPASSAPVVTKPPEESVTPNIPVPAPTTESPVVTTAPAPSTEAPVVQKLTGSFEETSSSNKNGKYTYKYKVILTNTSSEDINNWSVSLGYPGSATPKSISSWYLSTSNNNNVLKIKSSGWYSNTPVKANDSYSFTVTFESTSPVSAADYSFSISF